MSNDTRDGRTFYDVKRAADINEARQRVIDAARVHTEDNTPQTFEALWDAVDALRALEAESVRALDKLEAGE